MQIIIALNNNLFKKIQISNNLIQMMIYNKITFNNKIKKMKVVN